MSSEDEITLFVQNVANEIAQHAQGITPKASGDLIRSISCEVREPSGWRWQVVFKAADYWEYLSEGRKPGAWPPREAIVRWIEVKPIIPTPDHRGRIPTIQQLAFLICRKIWRQGTTPRNLNFELEQKAAEYRAQIIDVINDKMKI